MSAKKEVPKLLRIGTSHGVIIPKVLLDKLGVTFGAEMRVTIVGGVFVVTPGRNLRDAKQRFQDAGELAMSDHRPSLAELD